MDAPWRDGHSRNQTDAGYKWREALVRETEGGGSERSSGLGRPDRGREAEQVILHLTPRGWAGVRSLDGKGGASQAEGPCLQRA